MEAGGYFRNGVTIADSIEVGFCFSQLFEIIKDIHSQKISRSHLR